MIADALNKPKPEILAKPWILKSAVILETIKSKLTGKEPMITGDTAKTAQTVSIYNNQKIREVLNYEFNSVENTVKKTAEIFKKEFSL
jgi:hypothetical protein